MDRDREFIVVLITSSSAEEGEKIATSLVDHHLVACVNMVPSVKSLFFWEGKTAQESEVLLIAKSRRPLLDKIVEQVKKIHSYKVPEIIALPVIGGSEEYLKWVEASTS
ncbi:MAG: divalent-cation tolerance protein CutA [Nitrospirae bacterium]|nr:divalent-cation tolerance protein CutA [Nitrospirota bacterium]